MRKRYIVYVTRGEDGKTDHVTVPMRYVYVFLAATITGMFTIAGMAGSYGRMLAKAETINRLRDELALSRRDYAHLEKSAHEKDVQVASLGSLATEVSALYGLTAGKLTLSHGKGPRAGANKSAAEAVAHATLKDDTDDNYYHSLDTFYALKNTAEDGLPASSGIDTSLGIRGALSGFGSLDLSTDAASHMPDMWPVIGPINSGFGEREDPILGGGEGEFHKGIDIGAPDGTPVHAPAAGRVIKAGMGNGYGREIQIDHGNGIVTLYGHLQGWAVTAGQQVVKGQVIGYTGHSGHTQGHHLHYEVEVHGAAVNPHKYLRTTMAQLAGGENHG